MTEMASFARVSLDSGFRRNDKFYGFPTFCETIKIDFREDKRLGLCRDRLETAAHRKNLGNQRKDFLSRRPAAEGPVGPKKEE
jgi:hypothetical protein